MLKFLLLLIGINSASLFSILTTNTKTQVHLHLERFNDDLNLYHIGISFKNNNNTTIPLANSIVFKVMDKAASNCASSSFPSTE